MIEDQTLPQSSPQSAGLRLGGMVTVREKQNRKIQSNTYPQHPFRAWSSAVPDPSPPTSERGQEHGPLEWGVGGKKLIVSNIILNERYLG
jgi:hypothetical protein